MKDFVAFRDELKKMAQYWEDGAATWSEKMKMLKTDTLKKSTQTVKHIAEVAKDTQVREESCRHVTSPLKRSATSSREHNQARPIRRQHHTARANKSESGSCSRYISSKHGYGFSYVQLPTRRKLPRSLSLRCKVCVIEDEPVPM
ncbi:hypothetical protein Bca52824_069357 [Brassica carinata]|uniref:Uncharacterized protein n=1 Tax=Brassica carinata TaxID=52824 RepID=A0A8X7Q5P4_BRACI|nr:hypothetical protein Bca52824_069357 [Brassica carinata]